MTRRIAREVRAEAVGWHLRLRDGGPDDWDLFVHWLEEDPANSDAFDAVQRAEAAITAETLPEHGMAAPANDDERLPAGAASTSVRRGHWLTGFAALAAVLLVAFLALPLLRGGPDRFEIATAAGRHRTVDLGDGSTAVLNGSTRIVLDRNDPRSVELAAGEATFTVRHDANRPFTVIAGDHSVQDTGTRFNLVAESGRFELAVIEGSVIFEPEGARVPLSAGQSLAVRGNSRPVVSRDDPSRFAGWQRGRLSYTASPLEAVAADLSRSVGTTLRVDPAIRSLPFTGSIRIVGDQNATIADFAATLGLRARREGNGWLIEPQARAPH